MITKQDYIDGKVSHREYYGQFVDLAVKAGILRDIGLEKILASKDESFNDIPLSVWDFLPCVRSNEINEKLIACGDFPSMAVLCCIAKEGARQLRDAIKLG